jgi:hypothetical protein
MVRGMRRRALALLALALCSSFLVAIAADEVVAADVTKTLPNTGNDAPSAVALGDAPSEAGEALSGVLRGELANNTKGKGRGGIGARVPKLTADGLAVASKIAAKSAAGAYTRPLSSST